MAFDLNNAPLLAAPGPPPAVALNTPLQNAEGMQKIQAIKQQQADEVRAQQAQDAFKTQLQQNNGDYDAALTAMDKQGYNTIPIRGTIADYRKKLYDNAKVQLESQKMENETTSSLMAHVTDQNSWDAVRPMIQRYDPQFVQIAGPQYDQTKFDGYKQIGVTAKDQHEWAQKALDDGADQKYARAAYAAAASTDSDQDVADARKSLAAALVPKSYIDAALPPDQPWSQATVDAGKKGYAAALTPKEQADVTNQQAERTEAQTRDKQTAAYQTGELGVRRGELAERVRNDKVVQAEKAGGATAGPVPTDLPSLAKSAGMTEQALKNAAEVYHRTGNIQGFGMQGAAPKKAIMNAESLLYPEGTDIATGGAVFKADASSLNALTKQYNAVQAYENTGLKNLKQFTDLAAKIPDTGVPWLNTPVRALSANLVGSENMAAVNAARQVALTEIAKVVNNPNLTGSLSDSGRQEVLGLNPANATLPQIKRVASVLQQDMRNRSQSMSDQIDQIKGEMAHPGQTAAPPAPLPLSANDVQAPNGKTYHFATQAQADAFKQRAGIQ